MMLRAGDLLGGGVGSGGLSNVDFMLLVHHASRSKGEPVRTFVCGA
jgi:hypothetical protein